MATDRTTQYALDVLADKIVAGDLVKAACQRHIDDMKAAEAAPYRYYFDVEEAERIIDFAETLTIAEGEEEQPVTAYPFQCFILGSLNGWRTKDGHCCQTVGARVKRSDSGLPTGTGSRTCRT